MAINAPRRVTGLATTLAAALAIICLFVAQAAPADTATPALTLGPVSVANGAVTLSGNVGNNPDGSVVAAVNGQPLNVDANGNFSATIDLSGSSSLVFTLRNPTSSEVSTISIPLNTNLVGANGVIPSTILDPLRQAGITLTVPPNGFTSVNGQPLPISGTVVDPSTLSALGINGTDVLSSLQPNGDFSLPIPGSSKSVTITATDQHGVSQASTFPVQPLTSTISTRGSTVAATSAVGIKVTAIKYHTARVKSLKRITMTVTVKDSHGVLIRGAKLRVRAAAFQSTLVRNGQQTKATNAKGTTTFTLSLRAGKFTNARRLFVVTTASTPSATARRTTSVRIPKLTKPAKHNK